MIIILYFIVNLCKEGWLFMKKVVNISDSRVCNSQTGCFTEDFLYIPSKYAILQ